MFKGQATYKKNVVPLVVTYNLNFKNLAFLIRKNLQLLYTNQKQREILSQLLFPSKVLGT